MAEDKHTPAGRGPAPQAKAQEHPPEKGTPQLQQEAFDRLHHRDFGSRDEESLQKDATERLKRSAQKGSVTGKASGDIFQHAPTGPIVGEVFKTRADLQKPKSGPVPGVRMPQDQRKK